MATAGALTRIEALVADGVWVALGLSHERRYLDDDSSKRHRCIHDKTMLYPCCQCGAMTREFASHIVEPFYADICTSDAGEGSA